MRENSALLAAIQGGDVAAVADQLDGGADPNMRAVNGLTPLMITCGLGKVRIAEMLLAAGADVHVVDPRAGATALHKAALSGDPDVITLVLGAGAFIDQQCPVLGHTALHDAVVYKQADAAQLLLQHGARTVIKNHWQETALDLARRDGLDEIARMIEAADEASERQLHAAPLASKVEAGDLAEVERHIGDGADVNVRLQMVGRPNDAYTPLAIAAREGHADIVKALLECGANPRPVIGLFFGTAIHEASYFGHADVIRTMTGGHEREGIEPAELDIRGAYNGFTPLHDAVWHGHVEAAQALVEAGARLDLKNHAGLTPRELAAAYGYAELARLLADAEQIAATPIADLPLTTNASHLR